MINLQLSLKTKWQSDVLFIGDKIAIGKTISGKECNLQEIIKEFLTQ